MFSISIMASKEREHFFPYLKEKLGDIPFAIDAPRGHEDNVGIWENCKRAWRLYDKTKDYHLVLQDDSLLTDDFIEKVNNLISQHKNCAFQLYVGEQWDFKPQKHEGYFSHDLLFFGVAIIIPTHLIEEMLEFGDWFGKKHRIVEDDTRIRYFLIEKGMKTIYPYPSLVQHRDSESSPTLLDKKNTNRQSPHFI